MSDSWDEKYDRNKDKAKEAFEDNAQQRGPSVSNDMEAALDGLRDRRRGPEDHLKTIAAEGLWPPTTGAACELYKNSVLRITA